MQSRRNFIGKVASGLAGTLAVSNVLGANERLRLGIIGAGDRGMQIVREAMACPNTDFVAFADIYTKRLEDAKKVAPNAKTYLDHRYLLDDKSIDAVLIATPQHLHCEHFTAALDAGKHVYQEKTMAFNVDHAKRMRAAYKRAGKRTVQIGHQSCSSGQVADATSFLATEHPEEILFTWDSGFGNSQLGNTEDILGTDGTISKGQQIRYTPQKVNRPDGTEMVGATRTAPNAHMQNFLDSIRLGKETNCPFDVGFRVSIACRMAVESYRQGRAMRWDAAAEEIV